MRSEEGMDEGSDDGPGPEHELVVGLVPRELLCLRAQTRERERESFLGREIGSWCWARWTGEVRSAHDPCRSGQRWGD